KTSRILSRGIQKVGISSRVGCGDTASGPNFPWSSASISGTAAAAFRVCSVVGVVFAPIPRRTLSFRLGRADVEPFLSGERAVSNPSVKAPAPSPSPADLPPSLADGVQSPPPLTAEPDLPQRRRGEAGSLGRTRLPAGSYRHL